MTTPPVNSAKATGFAYASPEEAAGAMCERAAMIQPGLERIALDRASGRILAEPLRTDRPSPAVDVSAMDGYAVGPGDLLRGQFPIAGDVWPGQEPPPPGGGGTTPQVGEAGVLRIFTGAPVPDGTEAVIRREDVEEHANHIVISAEQAARIRPGANIRRKGENAPEGALIADCGAIITPALAAALAAFGHAEFSIYRRVRVAIIVTGDEVLSASSAPTTPPTPPTAWQLRDSNGPALYCLLSAPAWLDVQPPRHVRDEPGELRKAIEESLAECDALCLTGGVSMGDRDYVPQVLREMGAEVLFHRLPQRPGKPVLGAYWQAQGATSEGEGGAGREGRIIFGLPGNPVAVMVTGRRLVAPVLRRLSGQISTPLPQIVSVAGTAPPLDLWRFMPVRVLDGGVELIPSRGSGDIVAAAASDGFVEVPPGESPAGLRRFFSWSID